MQALPQARVLSEAMEALRTSGAAPKPASPSPPTAPSPSPASAAALTLPSSSPLSAMNLAALRYLSAAVKEPAYHLPCLLSDSSRAVQPLCGSCWHREASPQAAGGQAGAAQAAEAGVHACVDRQCRHGPPPEQAARRRKQQAGGRPRRERLPAASILRQPPLAGRGGHPGRREVLDQRAMIGPAL